MTANADAPVRHVLRAGPLTAVLENGGLHFITYAGHDVLREIYAAVRDRNWGTASPVVQAVHVDQHENGFTVCLRVRHVSGEVDFVWDGEITGDRDGTLRFSFCGHAQRDFLRNRIGLCVLHAPEAAGATLSAQTAHGGQIIGVLPEAIAPHMMFADMEAMRWEPVPGLRAELRFTGDLFEMEDQRNWTDASFKTFGTPLDLPFPVQVREGDTVEQSVTLATQPSAGVAQKALAKSSALVEVGIGTRSIASLPQIGLMAGENGAGHDERAVQRLRELHLSHLWLELNLTESGWDERLQQGAALARAIGADLEIQAVCGGDRGEGLNALAARFAAEPCPPIVRRLSLFPASEWTTSQAVVSAARTHWKPGGIAIGGGSRAYFAQLNRAENLPLRQMDFVGFSVSPQVHAFDDAALFESLPIQAQAAQQAQSLSGGLPVCVGPITLRPRVEPAATGSPVLPLPGVPPDTDARQSLPVCAAWTLGSISRLARAGAAASVTYFETVGPRGVLDEPTGTPFPVYHVFAAVGSFAFGPGAAQTTRLLEAENSDEKRVTVLALRNHKQVRVLAASLSDEPQTVLLRLPFSLSPAAAVRFVDGTVCPASRGQNRELLFELPPFAVVYVDQKITKARRYEI